MTKLALAMIVKNEAHVIERCLRSILPLVNTFIIADTGSTDDTVEVIDRVSTELGIEGTILHHPWIDFAYNRNLVIHAARADGHQWVVTIDADEVFELDHTAQSLEGVDAFDVAVHYAGSVYSRRAFFKPELWYYKGVVHEYLTTDKADCAVRDMKGARIIVYHEGARSRDPLTYRKDALLLETALMTEMDTRNVFYCAQSWRDAGDKERALHWYRKRIEINGGYFEEVRYSYYQIAKLTNTLEDWLWACERMETRVEPVYWLGKWLNEHKMHNVARMVLATGRFIKPSTSDLFAEHDIHDYKLEMEYAVALHYCEYYADAVEVNEHLLYHPRLPQPERDLVERNLAFSRKALTSFEEL